MRVIGVLDIAGGRAVHARGGHREAYQPVRSRLTADGGDAMALARAYRDVLSLSEIYVADLDAITGGAAQRTLIGNLASLGGRLMVDAGVSSIDEARRVLGGGAVRVVVGLETLGSFGDLADIVRAVGREGVTFSLDLRDGQPVVPTPHHDPIGLVEAAEVAGVDSVIVLDLARVGTGLGPDLSLLRLVRRHSPALELIAGGGVRDRADIERLRDAGCDAALVATALHEGRLTREEIERDGE